MGLAESVDANSVAREARSQMSSSSSSLAQRLARSMGPGTDDTQFRQRVTILFALQEKLVAEGGSSVRSFADGVGTALPRNTDYIRRSFPTHPLRRYLSTDAALQLKAVEIGNANGPMWDFLRSALLSNNRDSMLGSLASLHDQGTVEGAGAIRPTVTEFFTRLGELDSVLNGLVTSGTARYVGSSAVSFPATATLNYTDGPVPGDPTVSAGGTPEAPSRAGTRRTTGTGTTTTPSAPIGTGGVGPLAAPVPDFASGALSTGGGAARTDLPSTGGGAADAVRKARLLRTIASNLGVAVPSLVRAIMAAYALWVLIRRGQAAMGVMVQADDTDTVHRTNEELRGLAALVVDDRVPGIAIAAFPGEDPVRAVEEGR